MEPASSGAFPIAESLGATQEHNAQEAQANDTEFG